KDFDVTDEVVRLIVGQEAQAIAGTNKADTLSGNLTIKTNQTLGAKAPAVWQADFDARSYVAGYLASGGKIGLKNQYGKDFDVTDEVVRLIVGQEAQAITGTDKADTLSGNLTIKTNQTLAAEAPAIWQAGFDARSYVAGYLAAGGKVGLKNQYG